MVIAICIDKYSENHIKKESISVVCTYSLTSVRCNNHYSSRCNNHHHQACNMPLNQNRYEPHTHIKLIFIAHQ
jgi:thymidine kinase